MSETRIKIIGGEDFVPREWLRKEVLWASLMTPYSTQMDTWLQDTALPQHHGNSNRQNIYSQDPSVESQALSFFNQGKKVAGLISSSVMFKAHVSYDEPRAYVNVQDLQASGIDIALTQPSGERIGGVIDESVVFEECARLADLASRDGFEGFAARHRLLRASRVMISLATQEAVSWMEAGQQNADRNLPILYIQDGGYPRSAGDRVNKLQPIFKHIVESESFKSY